MAMDSFVSVLFIYEHYLGFQAVWKFPCNLSDICLLDIGKCSLNNYQWRSSKSCYGGLLTTFLEPGWENKIIPENFMNCNYVGKLMCNLDR